MSNHYPLDDLFRDRFNEYEPELPEQAWTALQHARKRRRRRLLVWWISGSSILLCLVGLIWINWPSDQQAVQAENTPLTLRDVQRGETNAPDMKLPNQRNSIRTEKTAEQSKAARTADENQENATSPNNGKSATNIESDPLINPGIDHQKTTRRFALKAIQSDKHHLTETRNPTRSKRAGSSVLVKRKPSNPDEWASDTNRDTLFDVNTTNEKDELTVSQRNREGFAGLITRSRSKETTEIQRKSYPGCPSLERDAAANKKYMEWYAGPDWGLKSYQDTGSSTYLQRRRESTDFRWAFSAGFRYTRVFQNGVSFRTGVNFTQITERFRWVKENYVQLNYTIDPTTGDTTGTTSIRGTRFKTTYNRFRSLDIPILFGYETGFGKFKLNAYAGGMLNIYSWQRGEVLDTSLRPVVITTGKPESPYQYRNNMGIGLTGGVSLYYRIHDNWQLMAEPYFRYNLSPMNREGLTLRERYHLLGLRIGIRRDLW